MLVAVVPIATAAALDYDLQGVSVFMVTLGFPMASRPSGILEHAYMMFSSLKNASLETVWDARMQVVLSLSKPLCLSSRMGRTVL